MTNHADARPETVEDSEAVIGCYCFSCEEARKTYASHQKVIDQIHDSCEPISKCEAWPWRAIQTSRGHINYWTIKDAADRSIVHGLDKETAEYIVLAANNHKKMYELLLFVATTPCGQTKHVEYAEALHLPAGDCGCVSCRVRSILTKIEEGKSK